MNKLFILSFALFLVLPLYAESEYIEDESFANRLEQERLEKEHIQRMENSSYRYSDDSTDGIDYTDRTRTNRERKAINTSGDASDDR